jgi:hypothetical protein
VLQEVGVKNIVYIRFPQGMEEIKYLASFTRATIIFCTMKGPDILAFGALPWRTILPLYDLSLIFPYRSYIGTLAKGIGDHIHLGGGLSRGVRFPTQIKGTGAGPLAADAKSDV